MGAAVRDPSEGDREPLSPILHHLSSYAGYLALAIAVERGFGDGFCDAALIVTAGTGS